MGGNYIRKVKVDSGHFFYIVIILLMKIELRYCVDRKNMTVQSIHTIRKSIYTKNLNSLIIRCWFRYLLFSNLLAEFYELIFPNGDNFPNDLIHYDIQIYYCNKKPKLRMTELRTLQTHYSEKQKGFF